MRYLWNDLRTIIDTYNGGTPLAHFLKNYFKQNHRLGSRDRRILSDAVYAWYRASKSFPEEWSFEEKVQACVMLCATEPHTRVLLPDAHKHVPTLPLEERAAHLQSAGMEFHPMQIIPEGETLSEGIAIQEWQQSLLKLPYLYIRVRQDKKNVQKLLKEAGIDFEWKTASCIGLPNGSPVDKILSEDSYVVQDISSQQTGMFFNPQDGESWYDCCAGAGGKSLLLLDMNRKVRLTATDVRDSILQNLKLRFRRYNLPQPELHVLDVADKAALKDTFHSRQFDAVLCDVPCSGSGTWGRTPEQLYYFTSEVVDHLSIRQQAIVKNAAGLVRKGGKLIYATCSVFERENEAIVQHLLASSDLQLQEMKLINGTARNSDSLFVAVFKKP